MLLRVGEKLGEYELVAPLGAGGMGEVYRARDHRLGRDVAIKVLPASLAEDDFSLGRFEREARAVAALSHPNIVRIFDYGQEGTDLYAVMELLEGQSLRERLSEGSLPISKAVRIAREVSEGLAAAHDQGIIHRDLKPENIFLTEDGRIKILDFGLAKTEVLEVGGDDDATLVESQPGALLGTIEYMSPEQLRSQEIDSRSDLFALGMVLYEMLSGTRAFRKDSLADTMSAILSEDPEPIDAERSLPPVLMQIVGRCLEKRPSERFQSARDLAFALSAISTATGSRSGVAHIEDLPRSRGERHGWLFSLGMVIGLGLAVGIGYWLGSGGEGSEARPSPTFRRLTTLPGPERTPCLGPGGLAFVFVSDQGGDDDIYLQRIGGQKAIDLTADSEHDDTSPAFSPDGETIAFRSERQGGGIFVMGATGESVRRLTDFGNDPAWSPDGASIVVAGEGVTDPLNRATTSALWVVQTSDGSSELLFEGDAAQPDWSPGGHRIAFFSVPSSGQRDLFTIPADGSGEPIAVTQDAPSDWSPLWSPDGRWLYFSSDRGGAMSLWRVRIEESSGRTLAEPEALTVPAAWAGDFTRTADGKGLAYATRETRSMLSRVSFSIDESENPAEVEAIFSGSLNITDLHLSPDGTRVAFTTHGSREDLFVVNSDGTGFVQLTDDSHRDRGPQWSPDAERIAFYSNRGGRYEIWAIRADGSGLEQLTDTAPGPGLWYPTWSPDGMRLAIAFEGGTLLIDLDGSGARETLPAIDEQTVFQTSSWSSDGEWLGGLARRQGGMVMEGMWTYHLPEQRFVQISSLGAHPLWSDAAKGWLGRVGRGVALYEVETEEWYPLFEVRIGNPPWRKFAAANDNNQAVFIENEQAGDIWWMEWE